MSGLEGNIVVITGAGVSKDSGIPTFRGEDGYYLAREPISIEQYEKKPEAVWSEIAERREIIARAMPNRVHELLVEIEKHKGEDFYLITQNIDGLHRKAGSERLLEVHGNVWQLKEEQSTKVNDYLEILQSGKFSHLGYTKLEYLTEVANKDFCHVIEQAPDEVAHPDGYRPNITFLGESLTERLVPLSELLKRPIDQVIILGSSLKISTAPMIVMQIKSQNPDVKIVNVDPYANSELDGYEYYLESASEFLEREFNNSKA